MITEQEIKDALTIKKMLEWLNSKADGEIVADIPKMETAEGCVVARYLQNEFKGRYTKIIQGIQRTFVSQEGENRTIIIDTPRDILRIVDYVDRSRKDIFTKEDVLYFIESAGLE